MEILIKHKAVFFTASCINFNNPSYPTVSVFSTEATRTTNKSCNYFEMTFELTQAVCPPAPFRNNNGTRTMVKDLTY